MCVSVCVCVCVSVRESCPPSYPSIELIKLTSDGLETEKTVAFFNGVFVLVFVSECVSSCL